MNPSLMSPTDFAAKVRAKYPDGVASDGRRYADIGDEELTQKVVEKFPVYRDQIEFRSPTQVADDKSASDAGAILPARTGEGPATALGKAVVNTPSSAVNLGKNVAQAVIHPVQTAKNIYETGKGAVRTAGEAIGAVEDNQDTDGEVMFDNLRTMLKERYWDPSKSMDENLQTLQRTATNDPFAFGTDVLGMLTGMTGLKAGQLAGKANITTKGMRDAAAAPLRRSAEDSVSKVFAPTKDANKFKMQQIAGRMVDRLRVPVTFKGLQKQVAQNLTKAAEDLDEAIDNIPSDALVEVKPVIDAIEKTKQKFVVEGTKVIAEPGAYAAATELQKLVASLGSQVEFKSIRSLRQIWDKAVDKSNGFQKNLSDLDRLDIKKEAVNAIRNQLAQDFPELAKVNAEFSLWKRAQDILKDTAKRRTGQQGGLTQNVAKVAGGAVGFMKGGIDAGLITGYAAQNAIKLFQSPAWRMISAKVKDRIADAIASGDSTSFNKLILPLMTTHQLDPILETEPQESQ